MDSASSFRGLARPILGPDRLLYAAILLPCIALGALAFLLNERDAALATRRALEDRQRFGAEVSRALVDQLQGIIASETNASGGRYIEEATAFVARFEGLQVTLPSKRVAHTSPAAAAVVDRLGKDLETLAALRGALGEPRIVAYDSARYLIAARFETADRGQQDGCPRWGGWGCPG